MNRTKTSDLKFVVMGTGSIGSRHIRVLQESGEAEVCAVPIRPTRLAELKETGVCAFGSLTEAADWGARFAIIATDTARHLTDSLQAMEHGLDVLVEKPMALDATSARRLEDHVRELSRYLFVGCTLRFSDGLKNFRNLLTRLGSLHFVRIACQSYLPDWRPSRPYRETYSARKSEGGVLRDLIHEIDYAGWLYGWPRNLVASVRNQGRLEIEADEAADLLWETEGGTVVSMSLDYLSRSPIRLMTAHGEAGALSWDGLTGSVSLHITGTDEEIFSSSQTRDQMLLDQSLAFANVCIGGSSDRIATAFDGTRALAICDAARRSSTRRVEEVIWS